MLAAPKINNCNSSVLLGVVDVFIVSLLSKLGVFLAIKISNRLYLLSGYNLL